MSTAARSVKNPPTAASVGYLKSRLCSTRTAFLYSAYVARSKVNAAVTEEKRVEESPNWVQFTILSVGLEAKVFQEPDYIRWRD